MKNKFKLETTVCPICLFDKSKEIFNGRDRLCKKEGKFHVVQCISCGLMYTNPRPTSETMGYFYPIDYAPYKALSDPYIKMFHESERFFPKIKNELKLQILKKYYGYKDLKLISRLSTFLKVPSGIKKLIIRASYFYFSKNYYRIPVWKEGGKTLDIGCASGAYLLLLKNLGWNVVGVDISDSVAKEVKEAKITIHTGDLKELKLKTGSFNLITLWHVLEHLHKPLQTLQEIHRLLMDDGLLFIEIPNRASIVAKIFRSNWFAWDLPRHLFHFSPANITKLLNQAGFKVVKIRNLSKTTIGKSVSYWLEDRGIKIDIARLIDNSRFLSYLLLFFGNLMAFFHTSDVIFIKAWNS